MKNIAIINCSDSKFEEYKSNFMNFFINLHRINDTNVKEIETTIKSFNIDRVILVDDRDKMTLEALEQLAGYIKMFFSNIDIIYLGNNEIEFEDHNLLERSAHFKNLNDLEIYNWIFYNSLSKSNKYILDHLKFNTNKKLVIMVGLPRSGKTTFVERYLKKHDYVILSSDQLRLSLYKEVFNKEREQEMWHMFREMYNYFIQTKSNIIIDSTNISYVNRMYYMDIAKQNKYDIVIIHIDTPKEICISRCEDEKLIEVINCMENTIDHDFSGAFSITI